MTDRTPTTSEVRTYYGLGRYEFQPDSCEHPSELHPEFDRWHAEEIRKAKAEALREFARNLDLEDIAAEWAACSSDEHMDVAHWAAGNAASEIQMAAFDYADLEEPA